MSYDKKGALADDVLFHLKGTGVDMSYEEALGLAENLLCDLDWEIRHLEGPESTSPPVPAKQDAAEAALALRADEFAQKVVDAVTVYLEAQGAKKARDCTDRRGHRFTVEYPPEGQFGWTRTFCERCGVKP